MLFPLTERYCIESRNGYRIACHKSAGLRVARTDIRPCFSRPPTVYIIHIHAGVGTALSRTGPASSGCGSQGVSHKGNGGGEGDTIRYIK